MQWWMGSNIPTPAVISASLVHVIIDVTYNGGNNYDVYLDAAIPNATHRTLCMFENRKWLPLFR